MKIILRGNQDDTLLRMLDLSLSTFEGMEHEDWCKDTVQSFERLRDSIERQMGLSGGEPAKSVQKKSLEGVGA